MNHNELKESLMKFGILDVIEISMKEGERIYIRKYGKYDFNILGSNFLESKIIIGQIFIEKLIDILMLFGVISIRKYSEDISGR